MPTVEKKPIPSAVFFILFPLALILDFSLGLIPILGMFLGFMFSVVTNINLSLAGYDSHQIARLAAVVATAVIEFLSVSISPSNTIYIGIIFILNFFTRRQFEQFKKQQEAVPIE